MNCAKVKICGITSLEDAVFACKAGADALGFVFYEKSPRYINPEKAREISLSLPPFVKKVALFVNKSPKFINDIMLKTCMDIAQIHFEVSQEFFKELNCDYIEVKRIKTKEDISTIKTNRYILVDAFVENYGGEGKMIDKEWFKEVDCSKMILAGGLNENNIKEVQNMGFYGYDVSSGVEKEKGIKDHKKIENFIRLVKNYDKRFK